MKKSYSSPSILLIPLQAMPGPNLSSTGDPGSALQPLPNDTTDIYDFPINLGG